MCPSFPNLQILPIQSLLTDEQVDVQRVGSIVAGLTKEGVLRDPPIVAKIGSGGLRYVVLDGADYVIALIKMKVPYVLGQVVAPEDNAMSRALRVNYPLTELMAGKSLVEKNNTLQAWLQNRISDRSVRCYEEATILFDE